MYANSVDEERKEHMKGFKLLETQLETIPTASFENRNWVKNKGAFQNRINRNLTLIVSIFFFES